MKKNLSILFTITIVTVCAYEWSEKIAFSAIEHPSTFSTKLIDPQNVPGKWLISSSRNPSGPGDSGPHIFSNGQMMKLAPNYALNDAVWSPDGRKILASQAGDPISYLRVFGENGALLETIETNRLSRGFDWVDDERIVYGDGWTSENEQGLVNLYNIKTKEKKILYKTPFKYDANDLRVSPDQTKLIFSINPILSARNENLPRTVLVDLISLKVQEMDLIASLAGWLPDSKSILALTNRQADKSKFNNRFGVIGILDIETAAFRAIKDVGGFYRQVRLSKDGRYIYYAKSIENGGVAAFVQSVESNDEWQITEPVLVSPEIGMSADFPTSWIPDPNKDFLSA